MLKVVPELDSHIPDQPANLTSFLAQKLNWYNNVLTEEQSQESAYTTLIRKNNFKLYKYDTRCKNPEKVFSYCPEDYLDPLDKEMLKLRHKQMNVTSSPAPKWLNMCWDSFRHVDNHNKSHIFQPRLQRPLQSLPKGASNGGSSAP